MSKQSATIVGTGDVGRALGKRLLMSNYEVTYGSRNPAKYDLAKIDENLREARVETIAASLQRSDLIILAVPFDAYPQLKQFQSLLAGKIVVDVSNGESKPKHESNAERLASMLPDSKVVKAFNTISAYSMHSDGAGERRLVYVCGEDPDSRAVVKQMAQDIRFVPIDCGGLLYARELETMPHTMLAGWLPPTIVMLLTLTFWLIYGTLRYYYIRDDPYGWERFPTNVLNKFAGCISMWLLPLAFLPSCFAGFAQLINGTKYKRFPAWLDGWLKMRKYLGYYSLLYATMHMVMSLACLSPAYYSNWFHFQTQVVPINRTEETVLSIDSRMTWLGETATLLGVLALMGMFVMGITSLPSVAAMLNWAEWRFFQSYLGWLTLVVATSHPTLLGAGASWQGKNFVEMIQTMTFLGSVFGWFTLLMKVILLLPGICCHLADIRQGYERGQSAQTNDIEDVSPIPMVTITTAAEVAKPTSQPAPNGHAQATSNGQTNIAFVAEADCNAHL